MSLRNFVQTIPMPFQKIRYLITLLLCAAASLHAQTTQTLTNNAILQISTYDVLKDQQYTFDQVLKDTSLHFKPATTLHTAEADYYWIRIVINNPYPNKESYQLSLSLPLNYTLYFYDSSKSSWSARSAGLAVASKQRQRGVIPCILEGDTKNIIYLKINTWDIRAYGYPIKPAIILEKRISFDSSEAFLWYSWLAGILVLVSFVGYNIYIYVQLRDHIYRCYLAIQVGAIIFITAFKHFFNLFLPFTTYNIRLEPDGSVYTYDLNAFLLHFGAIIIIGGMLQLSRLYLRTKVLLPACDRLLQCLLYGYLLLCQIPAVSTITGIFYLDNYTLWYDNIGVLLISVTVITICMIAYKYKVRAAKHFLLANTLPLFMVAGLAVYFIIHSAPTYLDNHFLLPEIGVFSQILSFAVALIARIRIVNEELKAKEQEMTRLEKDIAETSYRCALIEKENELIILTIRQEKDRNEQLQQKLEANQRELMGNSLYIHQKNKLLEDLKNQLQDIDQLYPHVKHPGLKDITSSLKEGQYLDAEWDKFKLHFEQVHPNFFENLQTNHPTLTKNELRLYAYFHIHLSTKEIAALLNIEPASVRQAKARLMKKMRNPTNVTPEGDL
ncbi:7TM-DISM domain-containing protein [Chitinophaga arvensicola]|uniref:7TMR-DISM extracellular 2 n=1 Tax=Chitinophaga arvensicola TaxID=29529 RepID=A0A1I0PFU9_9BACT|nr:7TM-DISM domain-containing protein [Chitinophaga arvensicola]SEW13269.1 7TMR-DISM extracellular 2 [Chitinophaga arvensicola]